MTSSAPISAVQRLERAERHEVIGDLLADAGDEWACVPYFYAAYHRVLHALSEDPVFDDPTRLSRVNRNLSIADRHVTRHHGRRKLGEWGVNDLVTLLYRPIAVDYERLHAASIDVRYGGGFRGDLSDVRAALGHMKAEHEAGHLRAP